MIESSTKAKKFSEIASTLLGAELKEEHVESCHVMTNLECRTK